MNSANRLFKAKAPNQEKLSQGLDREKESRGFLDNHLGDLRVKEQSDGAEFVASSPPVPETLADIGLPEKLLAQLFLKHAFYSHAFTLREMSDALKVPAHLLDLIVEYLKQQRLVDVSPRDLFRPSPTHLATDIRYTLSDSGKKVAEQELEFNSYVGPVPVSLEDYWDWVEAQTIQLEEIKPEQLREAFKNYVVPEQLFNEIGPAVASGRSLFLFGPSGNGKSVLARCIGEVFNNTICIPHALFVHGQIIRVYDESIHRRGEQSQSDHPQQHDSRWILCRRPVITAGGEMTEAALEPKYNSVSKYYEAPHQILANNGVLIIDDFGRQKISPKELLNRWMYPLETRQDFCNLHTGQQFAVPFDQLVIFCTNLDPNALADEAFLRRIRHKVFIGDVTHGQFMEIFERVCVKHSLNFTPELIQEMLEKHYLPTSRPLRACHPRDIIENLIDRARFYGIAPNLTFQDLDLACENYFIKSSRIIDYDQGEVPYWASLPEIKDDL
jgi:energy-coupling factor transporter ATP-binding protein EcfA2